MTKLYFIRHAEAEGNIYRRCHGQYDGQLTSNGLAQTERLRVRFAGICFDTVYTSDLSRAYMTSLALNTGKRIPCADIREMNMGAWEDRPWKELQRMDAEQYRLFMNTWDYKIEGAESAPEIQDRMLSFLHYAVASGGNTVAIVSHGVALRLTFMALYGYPLNRTDRLRYIDNASVSLVEFPDNWPLSGHIIRSYGDNSHIADLSTLSKQNWWRGKTDNDELWFSQCRFGADEDAMEILKNETWRHVYGNNDGYNRISSLKTLHRTLSRHPKAAQFVMHNDTRIGALCLDTEADKADNCGHIALLYLNNSSRGKGLGVQLLGEAVSIYRKLGRERLRLKVWPQNKSAVAFYYKNGFEKTDECSGTHGNLWIMEKPIGLGLSKL